MCKAYQYVSIPYQTVQWLLECVILIIPCHEGNKDHISITFVAISYNYLKPIPVIQDKQTLNVKVL